MPQKFPSQLATSHLHNLNMAVLRREVQWQPMVGSGCLELRSRYLQIKPNKKHHETSIGDPLAEGSKDDNLMELLLLSSGQGRKIKSSLT